MMNVKDLHLEKEIIPLFDFVHNDFSREALAEIFSEFPKTLDEVLSRQQIIQSLMRSEASRVPFFYYKSEVHQVCGYLKELENRNKGIQGVSLRIHFLFAKLKRSKEGTRLSQLIIFFEKIQQFYFAPLKEQDFPDAFSGRIRNIKLFFTDLDLVKYKTVALKRRFRISEIARLTEFLLKKIRSGEMDAFWKDFFLFEAFLSIARGILRHRFSFPVFNDSFSITDFYHPLLKHPVKNSLKTQDSVTLITGPNMAGKSTLLKALGICVVLAHLGLAVPAAGFELSFFEFISISINLNDDLESGYSHFMAEIKSLKNVVVQADQAKKCFAVFDELFRGTNVEDALAISRTTILGLSQFSNSCFFISTHLHQLKEAISLHRNEISTRFIECVIENNKPVFTYQLQEGWSDLKIGQIIFEQEGLNQLLDKK
jgi:DNA mismatch repair protein MutS